MIDFRLSLRYTRESGIVVDIVHWTYPLKIAGRRLYPAQVSKRPHVVMLKNNTTNATESFALRYRERSPESGICKRLFITSIFNCLRKMKIGNQGSH